MVNSAAASNAAARIAYISSNTKAEKSQAEAAENTSVDDVAENVSADNTDTVEISGSQSKESDFNIDVDSLIEQNNQRMQDFTSKLMSMVTKKGETANANIFGLDLTVTQQDIDDAKAAISEGGEWSVDAVSDRIMNMAYALSGGDESKLSTLKDAVLKGFKEAGFDADNRSSMPQITGDTYDEILNRFDDWEKNGMKPYGQETSSASVSEQAALIGTKVDVEA
jgi:hypothetical protein